MVINYKIDFLCTWLHKPSHKIIAKKNLNTIWGKYS